MSKGSYRIRSFLTGSERNTIASAIVATAVIAPVWIVTGGEVVQISRIDEKQRVHTANYVS